MKLDARDVRDFMSLLLSPEVSKMIQWLRDSHLRC